MHFFYFLFGFALFINCLGSVKNTSNQDCRKISGTPGPEDFVIDRETGIMYVSSHERRKENELGSLFTIDLKNTDPKAIHQNISYPPHFQPHGISLAKTDKGKKLFVISHLDKYMGKSHAIEIFSIEKESLKHEKTLTSETLINPNDLFATSDGRIFVSNDHGAGGSITQFFQDLFKLQSSPIAFYDGSKWSLLNEKISFGNGIHVRQESGKEFLYRGSTLDYNITKYEIQIKNGETSLIKVQDIDIDSAADNFELDDAGELLIAGHKSLVKFIRHKSSVDNPSPSQIFRVRANGEVKEIFADSGELISASSTGAIYKSRLYIAQVFEPFILSCKAPE